MYLQFPAALYTPHHIPWWVYVCVCVCDGACSQDIDSLERQISDDLNQGKTPLFIMAYAGTSLHSPIHVLISL